VNQSHVTTHRELGVPRDHDHEQCSTSDIVPDTSLEESNGFQIQVVEAYGERRDRKGHRRLLFWKKTETGMTQIDPLYPANVSPIGYEGLSLSTLAKTEELNLRLMRFQKKYDNCGTTKTGKVKGTACRDHIEDTARIFTCNCHRPGCEHCGDDWAWRGAERTTERIMGSRAAYAQEGLDFLPYDHVTFSPPESQYQYYKDMIKSTGVFPKLRVEMRKIPRLAGVTGAAEWFHPFRFKHADGSDCEIEKKDCPEKHHSQWSPHWHLISTGYLMNSDKFHKKTGWVYKKIQKNLSPRKIKLVAHYLSTHCGLMVGKESKKIRHDTVTYSGMISPSKLRVKHRKELVTEKCDICERPKEYFLAELPPLDEPFTQEHIQRWDGVVEYYADTRIYYLTTTVKAMEDYKAMSGSDIVDDYLLDRG